MKQVVSYGGGTNSVAMLVGLHRHGERPDAILFADTGGEKPHTYDHLWTMQAWCERVGFPSLTIIRGDQPQQQRDLTLEQECRRLGTLPSRAFGWGSCSMKWKTDPAKKWIRAHFEQSDVVRLVGFHAGEPERCLKVPDGERAYQRYPLIEWDWDYEECQEQIVKAGLPIPGKSACFYCPSSKKHEILELRKRYPVLLSRALEMERRAMAGEGQAPAAGIGLGRTFTWRKFLADYDSQPDLFGDTPEQCGEACFT